MSETRPTSAPRRRSLRRYPFVVASAAVHGTAFALLAAFAVGDGTAAGPSRVSAVWNEELAAIPDAPPEAPEDCPLPARPTDDDLAPSEPPPIACVFEAPIDGAPVAGAPLWTTIGLGAGQRPARGAPGGRWSAAAAGATPAAAPVPALAQPVLPAALGETRSVRFAATPDAPPYPERARQLGWEGRVVLRITVASDGRVATVSVIDSSGRLLLDDAAIAAARSWSLEPALADGRPVEGTIDVTVRFRLEE